MSDDLISEGRRHLVCQEVSQAVEKFQQACLLLSAEFGDLDERLAEPNLLYGSALLELSRMESRVLGNALDGVPEGESESEEENDIVDKGPEMTEEEKEDLSNQIIDAMCEDNENENKSDDHPSEIPNPIASEAPILGDERDYGSSEGEEEEEENENGDKFPAEENGSEDDISNLQLAWEVIEVAKRIFERSDSIESKLRVADCWEKLAEISREKEDYKQALSDFKECLLIRSNVCPENYRMISETHFQIGTTHAVAGDLDEASASFKKSVASLNEYAQELRTKISDLGSCKDNSQKLDALKTILKEVETLIPDVERRLTEIEEDRLATRFTSEPGTSAILPADPKTSNKSVDDITHLVRKKRQAVEVSTAPEQQNEVGLSPKSKKTKIRNGHNCVEIEDLKSERNDGSDDAQLPTSIPVGTSEPSRQ